MPAEKHVYKWRRFVCRTCGQLRRVLCWNWDPVMCCGQQMEVE